MRKYNPHNERLKRKYAIWLRQAKGRDEKTVDVAVAAILRFEESTKFKSFKSFRIEQATDFKQQIKTQKNGRTGKPLSMTTVDSTLRAVKAFFEWLSREPGFKKILGHNEVEYFSNTLKDARAARGQRQIPYPSQQSALRAFTSMTSETEIERRNKAIFAILMLTGGRDGALASLRLKHVNIPDRTVSFDAREVRTKNSKSYTAAFFPVGAEYFEALEAWVTYLWEDRYFSPDDPLFPKPERRLEGGKFSYARVSREAYNNAAKINQVIRAAFAAVGLPEYTPHSFRKTLAKMSNLHCKTMEDHKAWSQNLGHENISTTVGSYMPVTPERQADVIHSFAKAETN